MPTPTAIPACGACGDRDFADLFERFKHIMWECDEGARRAQLMKLSVSQLRAHAFEIGMSTATRSGKKNHLVGAITIWEKRKA